MSSRSESIRRRLDRQYLVVLAPEELDGTTAPPFMGPLLAVEDNTDIVIDLRRLVYCGSEAITMLLHLDRHARERNCTLTLSSPPPLFDHVVQACGVAGELTVRRPVKARERRLGGSDPAQR